MLSLNISSVKAIWMIQKAAAKGNWWLAASSWQHACSCITSHAKFFAKHQITQVTQTLYSPDLVPCNFWLFPKTKITFEREEISNGWRESGKYDRAADGYWENCEVPMCLLWRGLRHHCPIYNVSCILHLLQQMSVLFILHGQIPSGPTSYVIHSVDTFVWSRLRWLI